jgi:hypothetical protein
MRRYMTCAMTLALTSVAIGCGPTKTRPDSIASTSYHGIPSGAPTPSILPGTVIGVLSDRTLALTTMGSSSCPAVPIKLTVRNTHTVEVTFSSDYGSAAACSTDIVPTTSVIDLPDSVRTSESITVQVRGERGPLVELTVRP